ncbi:MAG: ABC transporter substrate-binding protein [Deltaproteobacteria bacterium]|nr:ABC transporter substrate-binding protein [Deltaproteobacteria bacterium]
MKKWFVPLFVMALFFLFGYGLLPSEAASPATKVVLTYANLGERAAAQYVAEDQGFFRKHDLDVRLVYIGSGSAAMAALAGGYAQIYTSSASGATLGAIAGGDVVFVAGLINKLTGAFVAASEIKSPAELKGKRIGVTSIAGGNWERTMLALDHWGLAPERDGITIRVIGNDSARAQALAAGMIDGTLVDYAFSAPLERQGYPVLADLARLGIPYQGIGVLTRRMFVNQYPETIEKILKSLVEAISFIRQPANKAAVLKSLARGSRLTRIEDAVGTYDRMVTLYDRRIYPDLAGIRKVISLHSIKSESIRRLKAEEIVDERFVRKLEKEGLF